jgi:hypothetical protein
MRDDARGPTPARRSSPAAAGGQPRLLPRADRRHRRGPAGVLLETYIFDFTGSGADIAYALERAARRGVTVRLVMDGFGTPELPPFWEMRFDARRVQWALYSRTGAFGLLWPGQWRRLHRKLCVVDETMGFLRRHQHPGRLPRPNYGALLSPRLDLSCARKGPGAADAPDHAAPVVAHRGRGQLKRASGRRVRAVARGRARRPDRAARCRPRGQQRARRAAAARQPAQPG